MKTIVKLIGELAKPLVQQIRSTKIASLLLALLIYVVAFGVIFFIFRSTLGENAVLLLMTLFMILAFIFIIVFLIRLLPDGGKNGEPKGEICGILKLDDRPVPGALIRLLTANGNSTKTDQDGLFVLLPDPRYREWKIRATYQSRGGNFYTAERLYKQKELGAESPPDIFLHCEEQTEIEIIYQRLNQLKDHVEKHRDHIKKILSRLIYEDKLIETIEGLNDLIEHHQPWSEPYSILLYGDLNLEDIRLTNEDMQKSLTNALTGVRQFKDAAFLHASSLFVLPHFDDAKLLYDHYIRGEQNDDLCKKLKKEMESSYKTLVSDDGLIRSFADMELNTTHDLIEFIKAWCKAWYRMVQDADKNGLFASGVRRFEKEIN